MVPVFWQHLLQPPSHCCPQAALQNVRAVAAALPGPSTTKHLFARADVVLAWYSDDTGTHLVPLINEISLINSASKLIDLWEGPVESEHWLQSLKDQYEKERGSMSSKERIASGWGRSLARLLAREIVSAYWQREERS